MNSKKIDKRLLIKILILVPVIMCAALFQTLVIKADIGVFAVWDAFSLNISELTGIKVGTVAIIANCCLVILQILILRKEFEMYKMLQVGVSILYGVFTNIYYYDIFKFEPSNYAERLILLIIGGVGVALFGGAMVALDVVATPAEQTSSVIHKKYKLNYAYVRIALDIIVIATSIALSLIFGLSIKVREGTIVCMVLLGPLTLFFMRLYNRAFKRIYKKIYKRKKERRVNINNVNN